MDTPLTGNEHGLAALCNFDDGTPSDITGNGNDGYYQGNATTIDDDFFGSCVLDGDLNGDEIVDIVDLFLTVDFILERNPQPFFFFCADISEDEEINIMNIIFILNIIINNR